jgi:hypothetical protein
MADSGSSHDYDDQRLTRYLLGTLTAGEADELDELSLTDEDFAGRLRVVEDDLLDAYARGDLDADVRTRFESRYLAAPGARERLRFAAALEIHQKRSASSASEPVRPVPLPTESRHLPMWALAAAASIVLAVASYVLLDRTKAHRPQPEVPPAVVTSQPGPPAVEPPRVAAPAQADEPVIAMVLMPPTRGPSESPTLTLRGRAAKVEMRLVLESDDFQGYEVILKDSKTDRPLWRSGRLQSSSTGSDRIVPVTIDATVLKPEGYSLELSGYRGAGGAEVITSYTFRVLR